MMELAKILTGLTVTALLVSAIGCSGETSVGVTATPHTEATIGAKTDAPTNPEQTSSDMNTLAENGLIEISQIEQSVRCAVGRGSRCTQDPATERGLFETGLEPKFPVNVTCPIIDHHYAMDYSAFRLGREYYHGGIDIPVPFDTPVIAAAAGEVIGIYSGEKSPRGIEIVLKHAPEDTDLSVWTFTQYTHFSELPGVTLGQSISMGEVIGLTGNTGVSPKTGEQANDRRPALHFGVLYNANGDYAEMKSAVIVPADAMWMDPNAFFLVDHPFDSETLERLSNDEKQVLMPVLLDDGTTIPRNTKKIWPYICSEAEFSVTDTK